jgi:penicillin-binding protein 1A
MLKDITSTQFTAFHQEDDMKPKPKAASGSESKTRKKRKPLNIAAKFILTVAKILIVFFVALTFALTGIVGGAIYGYIKTAPPITEEQLQLKEFTSFIYDSKGNEIAQLKGEQNRVWVDFKDIPPYLGDAYVSIEDERFYEHAGVDLKRMAGAVIALVKPGSGTNGASTITQQVVKNLTGDTQRSL